MTLNPAFYSLLSSYTPSGLCYVVKYFQSVDHTFFLGFYAFAEIAPSSGNADSSHSSGNLLLVS